MPSRMRAFRPHAKPQLPFLGSNLREELSEMNARSEAAERLLAEARSDLRERDAAI